MIFDWFFKRQGKSVYIEAVSLFKCEKCRISLDTLADTDKLQVRAIPISGMLSAFVFLCPECEDPDMLGTGFDGWWEFYRANHQYRKRFQKQINLKCAHDNFHNLVSDGGTL